MTAEDDEIVEEIRRRREAHAASFDYDLGRTTRDLQQQERESEQNVVTRAPKRPSPVRGPSSASHADAPAIALHRPQVIAKLFGRSCPPRRQVMALCVACLACEVEDEQGRCAASDTRSRRLAKHIPTLATCAFA